MSDRLTQFLASLSVDLDEEPEDTDDGVYGPDLGAMLSDVATSVEGLRASLQSLMVTLGQDAKLVEQKLSALQTALDETQAAMNAPKEIIRDADGRPTGVRIKKDH